MYLHGLVEGHYLRFFEILKFATYLLHLLPSCAEIPAWPEALPKAKDSIAVRTVEVRHVFLCVVAQSPLGRVKVC